MNNMKAAENNLSDIGTIENIVLRHSGRGMTALQGYLRKDFCMHAAARIYQLKRGVIFLTTGFFVSGVAETDGPPGTVSVARSLQGLGFTPIIITDKICEELFEPQGLFVIYVDDAWKKEDYAALLNIYHPEAMISIERCGRNKEGSYTNMRGVSISQTTAPIDMLFQIAPRSMLTVGIGDGGNEIGMGNLEDVIVNKVFPYPCCVTVDELIIATTSNWGAFALSACLSIISGKSLFCGYEGIRSYLNKIVRKGCIDGVTRQHTPSVDGFPAEVEEEIDNALETEVNRHLSDMA